MTDHIKVNDWVDALEGIAQVIEIKKIYKEEYPLSSLPPRECEVGELLNTIIIHKILCNFEGKIRKRNHVLHCSTEVCTPLCNESKGVLNELKRTKRQELEKFKIISQTKDFSNYVNTWIRVKGDDVQQVIDFINRDFEASIFKFSDVIDALKSEFNYEESWHFFANEAENTKQIVLKLNNTNYRFEGKKAVFTSVQALVL
ncbi:hypothetical protein DS2_07563 [Catenovulum agarivorans DS-2]|uniref:Uncharacterized protein n=1 Tax=Catenovulum agarivorans DS-2 TaxID=1328313 RepID=W7QNX3_9ALTE|nr:hypothetical protein [Catenovulum agarivorans]EWH10672.1 hypothetical protein DS2_07563 [Catenovulum agarivorans DS-2]